MSHLSEQQLSHLTTLLDNRYEELRTELHEAVIAKEEQADVAAAEVPDPADSSFTSLASDLDHASTTRGMAELREIERARSRVETGNYGTCTDCGTDIPYERLQVQPMAERCAPCQDKHEKTHGETQRGATL